MKLVKPRYEILACSLSPDEFPYNYTDYKRLIEVAGRTCYKSHDKITPDSNEKFFDDIIRRGHLSVIEHSWLVKDVSWKQLRESPFLYARYIGPPVQAKPVVAGNLRAWMEAYGAADNFHEMPDYPLTYEDIARFPKLADMAAITIRFICDRGVSHELVRHRPCSFSQESTRYCNYKECMTFVIPQWCNEIRAGEYRSLSSSYTFNSHPQVGNKNQLFWLRQMDGSEFYYTLMIENGYSPQQARSVLPNSLKTEIVMTCNFKELLHILKLRCSPAAHPQIRELLGPLRDEMITRFPEIFGGLVE